MKNPQKVQKHLRYRLPQAILLLYSFCSAASCLFANPTDPNVVAGQASFNGLDTNDLQITTSDRVIINWRDFSIQNGESTQFIQPDVSSLAVNRVTGIDPSYLYGNLSANGQIMIINPNGLIVGSSGIIDTGGFFASTLDISNQDLMGEGSWLFSGDSSQSIQNSGSITATGGNIILISREVDNRGTLRADNGQVAIGAGQEVLIARQDDAMTGFYVRPEAGQGMINNTGLVEAMEIELQAAGGNPYAFAINNGGTVRAVGYDNRGGRVRLLGHEGLVQLQGEIDAVVETGDGSVGGAIEILSPEIEIKEGTTITASGDLGGGQIHIGGSREGLGPLPNSDTVLIKEDVSVSADAYTDGDGGEIIVFADNSVEIYGEFSAQGGSLSGDGGFIETSGKVTWYFPDWAKSVDLSASNGFSGTFLIDPTDITIQDGTTTDGTTITTNTIDDADIIEFLDPAVGSGASLVITTTGTGGSGDITLNDDVNIAWTSSNSLTLDADRNIIFNSGVMSGATITSSDGDITLNADRAVTLNGIGAPNMVASSITATGSGNILINANTGAAATDADAIRVNSGATIQTNTGSITLNGTGGNTNLDMGIQIDGGEISSTSGTITLTGIGAAAGDEAHGILIENAGSVSSASGVIVLNGTGSTGADSHGVTITGDSEVESTGSATITINATSQSASGAAFDMTSGANVIGGTSATGNITIIADSYDGTSGSIQSSGNLVIAPENTNTSIGLGGGVGDLNLTTTEINTFANNFSSITIGDASSGTGAVDIDGGTFADDVTIVGGSIAVTGLDAGSNSATLTARTGPITDGGDAGTDVTAAGGATLTSAGGIGATSDLLSVSVSSGSLTTDTTGANGDQFIDLPTGANGIQLNAGTGNVTVNSTGGISDTDGATDITATAATLTATGNIGAGGLGEALDLAVSSVAANSTTSGDIYLSNTGVLAVNGVTTTASDIGITSTGNITISTNVLARSDGNVEITSTTGSITVSADVKSVMGTSGNTGDGTGTLTFTADTMNFSSGDIASAGQVIIQPQTDSTTIGIGDSAAGTLNLDATELGLLQDGFSLIVFGKSTGTGDIDLNPFTFLDPVTIAGGGTLIGPDATTTYTINGTDTGTLDGFGQTLTFQNIASLTGGSMNDTFNFISDGASMNGSLSGDLNTGTGTNAVNFTDDDLDLSTTLIGGTLTGGGTDTVSYANQMEAIIIDFENGTANGLGNTPVSIENIIGNGTATTLILTDVDDDNVILTGLNAGGFDTITFDGITALNGGGGNNSLTFDSTAGRTVTINDADAGSITGGLSFTGFANLTGGSMDDTFNFTDDGASMNGSLSGNLDTGTGTNRVNFTDADLDLSTTIIAGTLTGGGTDTVSYANQTESISINLETGAASGLANTPTSIEVVIGNGTDTTLFLDTGDDMVTLSGPNAGSLTGLAFSGVTDLNGGSGSNTLTFADSVNTITIDGADQGSLTGGLNWDNFTNLTGGSMADTFAFSGTSGNLTLIAGGGGSDILDYGTNSNFTTVAVDLGTGTQTATDAGGTMGVNISSIEELTGNGSDTTLTLTSANDSVVLTGSNAGGNGSFTFSAVTDLDGGTGTNSLTFDDAVNTITIDGADQGALTGGLNWDNFTDLTGGSMADTFIINNGASLSGTVDGGAGSNELDLSDFNTTVLIDLETPSNTTAVGGHSNIQSFVAGTATNDSLTGVEVATDYTITSAGTGTAGTIAFSGVETINAGSAGLDDLINDTNAAAIFNVTGGNSGNLTDTAGTPNVLMAFTGIEDLTGDGDTNVSESFVFGASGRLSGTIDGGTGVASDDIALSTINDAVSITGVGAGSASFVIGNFTGIESVDGGTSAANEITNNTNSAAIFNVTGNNSGNLTDTASTPNVLIAFSNMGGLTGGINVDDTFVFSDTFAITGLVDGGAGTGTNTLDLSDYSTTVVIDLQTPASTTAVANYSRIQSFVAGTATDNSITGSNTSTDYTITAAGEGTADNGVFDVAFSNIATINGGTGTADDLINDTNAAAIFNVTGSNSGNLTDTAGTPNVLIAFTGIEDLTGGSMADTFAFSGTAGDLTSISGGGGNDTLDYGTSANFTTVEVDLGPATQTATDADGVSGLNISSIEILTGNGSDTTLSIPDTGVTATIDGDGEGSFTGFTFTGITDLVGGSMADTFAFSGTTGNLTSIAGGGGNDTLDYGTNSNFTTVEVDLSAGTQTATDADGTTGVNISSIEVLTGNGSDTTLNLPDTGVTVTIDGEGDGSFTGFTFADITDLVGGSMADTFAFSGTAGDLVSISGGSGNDILDYGTNVNFTTVAVDLSTGTQTATDADGTTGVNISSIEVLTGNGSDTTLLLTSANDSVVLTGSNAGGNVSFNFSAVTDLDGGTGTNSLTFADAVNSITIDGDNEGSLSGGLNWDNFTNLTGGSMTDTFAFSGTAGDLTSISGGGGNDTLDYGTNVNFTTVAVDLSTGTQTATDADGTTGVNISSIEALTGNGSDTTLLLTSANDSVVLTGSNAGGNVSFNFSAVTDLDGGTGTNSLTFADSVNTITIDGADQGSLTSGLNWDNFTNLTGGSMADTFAFSGTAGDLTSIAGGGGNDTLDYGTNVNFTTVAVDLSTGTQTATDADGTTGVNISSIEVLTGNGSDTTLNLPNTGVTVTITGDGDGSFTGFSFTDITDLVGGTGDDTFAFGVLGALSGDLSGAAGSDTLDLSSLSTGVTVDLLDDATVTGFTGVTGTGGITGMENFTGTSGADTINLQPLIGATTRIINGGTPSVPTTPGDTLIFDAKMAPLVTFSSTLIDSAAGGTVTYSEIETLDFINEIGFELAGTNGDDRVTLTTQGDTTIDFDFDGGASGTLTIPVGALRWSPGEGADTLVVDASTGNALITDGILFDGGTGVGTGTADSDGLQVIGTTGLIAEYRPDTSTPGDGIVSIGPTGSLRTITFLELEPVDLTGFDEVTVLTQNANDVLNVANGFDFFNGGSTDAIRISGTSGGVTMETLALYNNGLIEIDTTTVDGDDSVTLASASNSHGNTSLAVTTGIGNDTINLNGDLSFSSGTVTLNDAVVLGADSNVTATTVTFNDTLIGGNTLTITGNAAFNALVGSGVASNRLASIEVTGTSDLNTTSITTTGTQTYGGATTIGSNLTLTGSTIAFGGTVNSDAGMNRDLMIMGAATFANTVGVTDRLASLSVSGTTGANGGDIRTTGNQSYTGIVTLGADLALDSGAGTITATNAVNGATRTLNLQNNNGTGNVTFNGAVTLNTLTTNPQAYAVAFNAGGMITTDTNFANTGGLTIGNDATDMIAFLGGVNTGLNAVNTAGTISTTNSQIDLGSITLTAASVMDAGTRGADINISQIIGGTNALELDAGTTGTITATNAANVVGNLTVTGASASITENDAITQGDAWDVTGTATLNAGGNAITLTNPANNFGTIELTAASAFIDDANGLNIGASTVSGVLDLDTAGAVAVTGAVASGSMNIDTNANGGTGGAITQTGALAITGTTVLDGGNQNVLLANATNDFGGAVDVTGADVSLRDSNSLTLGMTVDTANLTLQSGTTISVPNALNVGAGVGTLTIVDSAGTTFGNTVTAGTVTLTDTTGTISFQGNLTVDTGLTTTGQGYAISITGASNSIAGDTVFSNLGGVTIGDAATDSTRFTGGLDTTGVTGGTSIAGTVQTTNSQIDLGATTLTANSVINAGTAATIVAATLAASTHDVTLAGNEIDLNGGADSVTGSGNLTLAPGAAATSIDVAVTGGSGTLDLSVTDLAALSDGFTSITIGDATAGTGAVDVDAVTFTDTIHIVGGAIAVTGLDAGTNTVSLTARTGAISDGDAGTAATDVTASAASFSAATGVGTAVNPLETAILNLAAQTTGSGEIVIANTGGVMVATVNSISGLTTSGSDILLEDSGDIIINENVLARSNGNASIQSTGGSITVNADVKSVAATTGNTGDGSGNITFTADEMVFSSGSISASGGGILAIVPEMGSTTIGLGGGAGTLNLTDAEIALFADGFSAINIGLAAGTGSVDLEGFTALDPVTILGGASLTGPDDGNTYTINTIDGGTISGFGETFTFANIGSLIGGSGNDVFHFTTSSGRLTGSLNTGAGTNAVNVTDNNINLGTTDFVGGNLTGGGTDTLSYAFQAEAVAVNLEAETATGIGGTFSSIEAFTGGSNTGDSLTGTNTGTTYQVTALNTGTAGAVSFSDFENITGGSADDLFVFTNNGSLTGAIDGGGGTADTLQGDADGNVFSVTAMNTGTLTGKTSGWSNIESLVGGAGIDTFSFTNNGSIAGGIDGAGGNMDVITGDANGNDFSITALNQGTLALKTTGWRNVENLNGGAGIDTFTFANAGSLEGAVDGAGGTMDVLTGDNDGNAFTITTDNDGGLAGKTSGWSNIENLSGGTSTDTFTFSDGVTLSGTINGVSGANDEINYAAYNSPVTVDLETTTNTTAVGDFANIDRFVGGLTTGDVLIGANANTIWNISALNGGSVGGVSFADFENLTGGSADDTFNFTTLNGAISGNLVTGMGSNAVNFTDNAFNLSGGNLIGGSLAGGGGTDRVSYASQLEAVTFDLDATATGTTSGIGGTVSSIESITGGANTSDTILGSDGVNTWSLTSANTGTVNGQAFSSFENLTGGTSDDTFNFNGNTGSLTGVLSDAAGTTNLGGIYRTGGFQITGPTQLSANTNLRTTGSNGVISLGVLNGGGFNLALNASDSNAAVNTLVTQSGAWTNVNTLTVDASGESVQLANNTNSFQEIMLTASNATIAQTGAMLLLATAVQNNLNLTTTGGGISQNGTIRAGSLMVNADGNIFLADNTNVIPILQTVTANGFFSFETSGTLLLNGNIQTTAPSAAQDAGRVQIVAEDNLFLALGTTITTDQANDVTLASRFGEFINQQTNTSIDPIIEGGEVFIFSSTLGGTQEGGIFNGAGGLITQFSRSFPAASVPFATDTDGTNERGLFYRQAAPPGIDQLIVILDTSLIITIDTGATFADIDNSRIELDFDNIFTGDSLKEGSFVQLGGDGGVQFSEEMLQQLLEDLNPEARQELIDAMQALLGDGIDAREVQLPEGLVLIENGEGNSVIVTLEQLMKALSIMLTEEERKRMEDLLNQSL